MNAREVAAVVENDSERDRKTCISLDKKVDGANRELAQWLMDHPRYSGRVVAEWLNCGETRIRQLRSWACSGFSGLPFDKVNHPDNRVAHGRAQEPLKSNENFEDDTFEPDEAVEEPQKVFANVLASIKQSRTVAEAYRKILKVSPFDRGAKKEISDSIELLIRKWRSVQSALTAKGKAEDEQDN